MCYMCMLNDKIKPTKLFVKVVRPKQLPVKVGQKLYFSSVFVSQRFFLIDIIGGNILFPQIAKLGRLKNYLVFRKINVNTHIMF